MTVAKPRFHDQAHAHKVFDRMCRLFSTSPATCSMFCLKGESCTHQNLVFLSFRLLLSNPFLPKLTSCLPVRNHRRRGEESKEAGSRPLRGRRDHRSTTSSAGTSTPREPRACSEDKLLPLFLPQHDIRPPRPQRVRQNDMSDNEPVGEPSDQANSF
jgi:hypothetical protein